MQWILISLLFWLWSPATDVRERLQQVLGDDAQRPHVLAVYLPWFGDPKHISVGYSSQDPKRIRAQIREARAMGIDSFLVNWYGERLPFLDRSHALLQHIAAQEGFKVALMYDETEDDNGHATDDALQAFAKAYSSYIGPTARDRSAYLTYQGRPVIYVFPKRGGTDWNKVRESTNTWETPPLIFYKDDPPAAYAGAFDGFYPWVHPDKSWRPDGSDWGGGYLENFYRTFALKYPDRLITGTVWPAFDDTRASWGLDRHIAARCGQTFQDTLEVFARHATSMRTPFLMIATWNDYEEGTEVENGLGNCNSHSQINLKESH